MPRCVPDVTRFLHAISFGAPALALFFALRGLSEGFGLTRPTMYFSLLGLALLGPVGYVLMYGRLGLPALGALGSGIATAMRAVDRGARVPRLRRDAPPLSRRCALFARFEPPESGRRSASCCASACRWASSLFMEASLFVAVALAIGTLGTDVVASHQIAINVASVTFMVPLGIAMATTVRVGHAVGRGDARRRARRGSRRASC